MPQNTALMLWSSVTKSHLYAYNTSLMIYVKHRCVGELRRLAGSIWTLQKRFVKEIPEGSSAERFRRSLKSQQVTPFKAANTTDYMPPKCKSELKHKDTQAAPPLFVSQPFCAAQRDWSLDILCQCNISYETHRHCLSSRDLVYLQRFHSYLPRLIAGGWQWTWDDRAILSVPQR